MKINKTEINKTEQTINEINLTDIEQFIFDSGSDDLPTFGGSFEGGIQSQQVPDELSRCIKAIIDSGEKLDSYLEIGATAGGSAFIMHYFFNCRTIVLIDNNQHPKAHIRPYVLRDIPHDEIIGNSHDLSTVNILRSWGVTFDVILIDGDHFYEGVKADINNYCEFLRDGGFLIFHDSRIGAPYGTYKVAQGLLEDYRWELVDEYVSTKYPVCGIMLMKKIPLTVNKEIDREEEA